MLAAAIPLPTPEITPPVTKIYLVFIFFISPSLSLQGYDNTKISRSGIFLLAIGQRAGVIYFDCSD